MSLSKKEIEELVRQSVAAGTAQGVEQGVETVLMKYGFDIKDPLEMQKDMAHIRYLRNGCDGIRKTVVVSLIGGGLTALGTGIFILIETLKGMIK